MLEEREQTKKQKENLDCNDVTRLVMARYTLHVFFLGLRASNFGSIFVLLTLVVKKICNKKMTPKPENPKAQAKNMLCVTGLKRMVFI